MKVVFSVLFCCLATVALGEMAQQYRDYMVNWHNNFRGQHFAKNMNRLGWSDELAQQAEEYVSNCQFDNQYNGRGWNFAYYTDDMENMDYINRAFNDWGNERYQYDFSGNDCGMSCRYTQMVWYNTNQVGCAFQRCPQLNAYDTVYENAWFMGCAYSPYGNEMNGMNGMEGMNGMNGMDGMNGMNGMGYPYEFGTPCSSCYEQGMGCEGGLCVEQQWSNSYNNGEYFDQQGCQNFTPQDCFHNSWVMNNCRQMCNWNY